MIQTIIFLLLTIVSAIAFTGIFILSIWYIINFIRKKTGVKQLKHLKRMVFLFIGVMVINVGLLFLSQLTASTPDIRDENGKIVGNSIAELTPLELNGRKQWITIRGVDQSKPVLLFLAGGPGGSQMAAVRHELPELEQHFVVVNWDQPGSGKSYYAETIKDITTETYIQDGYALTEYLCERFRQKKIYLVGESWGSALGIFLMDRYPQVYHAFIGTGQMIDFVETEQMDYAKAMEIAKSKNDTAILNKLETNGVPPYYGKDVTWKSAVYLNYLSAYMGSNPNIHNPGYNTFRDIFSSEYGVIDKINYFRGIIVTFNNVYQKLYGIDLRKDYTTLEVPVYFFEGRHDVNAPPSLVEEYMEVLDAPVKKILWFEHSGHSPWINEGNQFVEQLMNCFINSKSQASSEDFYHTGYKVHLGGGNTQSRHELSLNKDDELRIHITSESGDITLDIRGKNGTEAYTGNHLSTGFFTVKIPETDKYIFKVMGKNAMGKIIIENSDNR